MPAAGLAPFLGAHHHTALLATGSVQPETQQAPQNRGMCFGFFFGETPNFVGERSRNANRYDYAIGLL